MVSVANTFFTVAKSLLLAFLISQTYVSAKVDTRHFCVDILRQTPADRKDCVRKASTVTFGGDNVKLVLLCCLGSFSDIKVTHNYNRAIDQDYLTNFLMSAVFQNSEAIYAFGKHVVNCSRRNYKLDLGDFRAWKNGSGTCRVRK